jgi:AcrR family transcriptional regulator
MDSLLRPLSIDCLIPFNRSIDRVKAESKMAARQSAQGPATGARANLVRAALRLFAEKGYEGASTREICDAAGANLSAIRYYFGDKAGLYRTVFAEPLGDLAGGRRPGEYATLPLPQALQRFYREFLEPLRHGEAVQQVMRLHLRELVEPTGVLNEPADADLRLMYAGLLRLLSRHFALRRADADLQRMAMALIGMATQCYLMQGGAQPVAPQLAGSARAIDLLVERVSGYAMAIVASEERRRGRAPVAVGEAPSPRAAATGEGTGQRGGDVSVSAH